MSMNNHVDIDNLFAEDNLSQPDLQNGLLDDDNQVLHDDAFIDTSLTSQAIAELTYCGLRTRIAWSKSGHIARITEDGLIVQTQLQRFNVKTSQWELSHSRALDLTFDCATSLAWSHAGNDLAVVDKQGRLSLFSCSPLNHCHDQLTTIRDGAIEDLGPFSPCIGLYWFTQVRPDKVLKTVPESTKRDGRWSQLVVESKIFLPCVFKACCVINAMGQFKVVWQRLDGQNSTTVQQIPIAALSVMTHAAIVPTPEGRLLVALHDYSGEISTFSVDVQFGQELQQNPQSNAQPTVTIETICSVLPLTPPFYDTFGSTALETRLLTHLELIPTSDINWEKVNGQPSKPAPAKQPTTLVAVYSTCEATEGGLQDSVVKRWQFRTTKEILHPRLNASSTGQVTTLVEPLTDVQLPFAVSKIELLEPGNALAISFLNSTPSFYYSLSFEPISTVSGLTTVEDISNIGLNFNALKPTADTCMSTHTTIIAQIDNDKANLTPTNYDGHSSAMTLNLSDPSEDALIAFYLLLFARSVISNAQSDDLLCTISHTVVPQSIPNILRYLYKTYTRPADFLSERTPNNVSELERVIQKTHLTKITMFHFTLLNSSTTTTTTTTTTTSDTITCTAISEERKLVRLWLWIALNLRWTYMQLMICYQTAQQQGTRPGMPPPSLPPNYVNMINNNIRWTFELFTFLFASLLRIPDRRANPDFFSSATFHSDFGDVNGNGSSGLVALIFNCAWSRSFLGLVVRLFGKFEKHSQKSGTLDGKNQNKAEGPLAPFANEVIRCVSKYGITVRAMDNVVDAIWSADTPKENQKPDASDVYNRQIEMMITGLIPEIYRGTLSHIVDECINNPTSGLRATNQIDRLRIAEQCPSMSNIFLNMDDITFEKHLPTTNRFEVMNGDHPARSNMGGLEQKPRRPLYNVHTKIPLFSAAYHNSGLMPPRNVEELKACEVRRCNRCGSLSDDGVLARMASQDGDGVTIAGGRDMGLSVIDRNWPRQSIPFMVKCVCEGIWIGERVGDGLF